MSSTPLDPLQRRAVLRANDVPRSLTGAARGGNRVFRREGASDTPADRKRAGSSAERNFDRPSAPRRPARQTIPSRDIGLHIRPEERDLMNEVGRFRLVAVRDAAEFLYGGSEAKLRKDVAFLAEKGFIETHVLNARRDGRVRDTERFEALTLTRRGRNYLKKLGDVPTGHRLYSGLVKPREAEHDAQVYRAFQKELSAIGRQGGRNARPRLDFELKAEFNRAVYRAQKAEPERDKQEIKEETAHELDLKITNGKAVVPDLRIEYDLPNGGGSAHVDVEVATAAYRHSHFAAKARAGFKMYVPSGDVGRLGAAVQDDHDIMSEILSL